MTAMVVNYTDVVATHGGEKITYADVITLCAYMAEHDYTPADIAYAVEKPWKYIEEIKKSREWERDCELT